MKFVSRKIPFITRWLLLAGVLSGLFFSSGEGIQLLPFPGDSHEAPKSSSIFEDGKSKKYSFSVHNSAAQQAVVKNKVQKDQKVFDLTDVFGSKVQTAGSDVSRRRQNISGRVFYDSAALLASPSNRAPPKA